MKRFNKDRIFAALLTVVLGISLAHALPRYVTKLSKLMLDQNALLDSDETERILLGSRTAINGTIAQSDNLTISAATLPTFATGNSYSRQIPVYNPTASTISAGSILISSDVASNTGAYVNVAGATIDLTTIIGVAAADISATSNGWMIPRGGGFAIALTTGTVSVGQTLVSSGTVAGRLGADATPTTGADVAIAMEAGTAAGDSILVMMK